MHPAFSVIFLTTLIGVGQGLFLALYTGQIYAALELLPAQNSASFYANGSFIALAFLIAGLIASFFHLGHPERAWRAASQWRTSWLSREVIVLPAMMGLVFLYGIAHASGWTQPFAAMGALQIDASLLIGLLGTLACVALFICTAMIYASVRFMQEWHSPLTLFNYLFLGSASGFSLAAAFAGYAESQLMGFYSVLAVLLTFAGLLTRGASLWRNARLKRKSNTQSAIGVRHQQVQQRTQGAMGGSFNTREFFHGKSAETVKLIKIAFLSLTFPLPMLLLTVAYATGVEVFSVLAFVIQYTGLILERWYFFAEARHPQNLYYQSVA